MASIKKRTTSDGTVRWDARVRLGRRIVTRTHRTKALAEDWARETEDRHRAGEYHDPTNARRTLTAYAGDWLGTRKLAPRTVALYLDLLERRIGPMLGDVEMRHLTPELVRRWWIRQPDQPYTAKAYRLLRSICATAVEDGVIRRQPCTIQGAGVERAPERPLASPAELAALAEAIDPRFRALLQLAAWGGLRKGEVLGLERRHVDLLHGTVRVEQQAQWLAKRGRVVVPPKTDAGRRVVHLPGFALADMEAHLAAYVDPEPDAPVAVGFRGGPLAPVVLQKAWNEARATAGLRHLTWHDLRHAAGTMVAQTGATQREIQSVLGHSSSAAAARYQHAAADRAAQIAAGLEAIAAPVELFGTREGRKMGDGTSSG